MKKLLIYVFLIAIVLCFAGCASDKTPQVNDTDTEVSTSTTSFASEEYTEETITEEQSASSTENVNYPYVVSDPSCGSLVKHHRCIMDPHVGIARHFWRTFDCWFCNLHTGAEDAIFDESERANVPVGKVNPRAEEIVSNWMMECYNADYTDPDQPSYLHFVRDFDIPRERFEKGCAKHLGFTSEMLDALYSDDVTDLYKYFLNPNAILVGEKVYVPGDLYQMTYDEMIAAGITDEQIKEKMPYWGECFYNYEFYRQMIRICYVEGIEYEFSERYKEFLSFGGIPESNPTVPFREPEYLHYFDEK